MTSHPEFTPLSAGSAGDRQFENYVRQTQAAITGAVQRHLPDAVLPEAAATAVLSDEDFADVYQSALPDVENTRGVYLAGINVVTVPQEFQDSVLTSKDKRERLHRTATLVEEYLHGLTTRPAITADGEHIFRTGFEPSVPEHSSVLEPGGVYRFIGSAALTEVLAPGSPDQKAPQRILTEATTELAVHLLLPEVTKMNDYPYVFIRVMGGEHAEYIAPRNAELTNRVLSALYNGDEKALSGIRLPVSVVRSGMIQQTTRSLRDMLANPNTVILSLPFSRAPKDTHELTEVAFGTKSRWK